MVKRKPFKRYIEELLFHCKFLQMVFVFHALLASSNGNIYQLDIYRLIAQPDLFFKRMFKIYTVYYHLRLSTNPIISNLFYTITIRKRSCGKVMFLHLSVSHSVHRGVYPSMHWGRHPLPGRHHPLCPVHAGIHPLPSACWDNPPATTAADGTHPTRMHTCLD